jgi:hypothetical protein
MLFVQPELLALHAIIVHFPPEQVPEQHWLPTVQKSP